MFKRKFKKLKYKGFKAIIHYDKENKIYWGKVENLEDFVNFHTSDVNEIENKFHSAVDSYIDMLRYYNKI